jgi:hypothetical protein
MPFLTTIVVPIVGNAAEHASALIFAVKNRMEVALGVAVGEARRRRGLLGAWLRAVFMWAPCPPPQMKLRVVRPHVHCWPLWLVQNAMPCARRSPHPGPLSLPMIPSPTPGSSTQVAVLIIPFCVVLAWAMGQPLDLNFNEFEALVLFISVLLAVVVLQDGSANYLKGLMLVITFLFISAGARPSLVVCARARACAFVRAGVHWCVRVRVRVHVRAHVRVSVCARAPVCARVGVREVVGRGSVVGCFCGGVLG